MLKLVAYGRGWRWPLECLEVWRQDQRCDVPAEFLVQMIQHYLTGLELLDRFRMLLTGPRGDPIRPTPHLSVTSASSTPRLVGVRSRRLRGRTA